MHKLKRGEKEMSEKRRNYSKKLSRKEYWKLKSHYCPIANYCPLEIIKDLVFIIKHKPKKEEIQLQVKK